MTAADIAKQTAYSAGQLIAAVKATDTEDNVILGHLRDTLRDLGAALGVIVDRVAQKQAEVGPRIVEPSRAVHGGIVAVKLRGRLNEDQLRGLNCIHCGRSGWNLGDAPMVPAGVLDGCALWRCQTDCTTPAAPLAPAPVGIAVSSLIQAKRAKYPLHSLPWYALDELLDEYQELLVAAEELEAP